MARPRKVVGISTGRISKQERMQREIAESKIKVDRSRLEAPDWLDDIAALEFDRVVYEAAAVDMLDNLDLAVLAIYADNYSRYREASLEMQNNGQVLPSDKGLTLSPYCTAADKAATQILKCSTKLGLATTDRLKLIVPTKEEKSVNKYIKYLKPA